jgi:hypothetical protein
MYISLMLVRCELLLALACLVAAGAILYLAVEDPRSDSEPARPAAVLATLMLWLVIYAPFFLTPEQHRSGFAVLRCTPFEGGITESDLKLTAWANEHLPPDKGDIGLAALPLKLGVHGAEKHIYPVGGAQAILFYGKYYNYSFYNLEPHRKNRFDDYVANVQNIFNADWCLHHNIRYFYIPYLDEKNPKNPGLLQAVHAGKLKLIKRFGSSGIYEVLPRPSAGS